jgi:hypothetical protein
METSHTICQTRHSREADVACATPLLALDLVTVLTEAENLQILKVDGHYSLAGITITKRSSRSTMHVLDIGVSSSETLHALGYITHFSNLRKLSVDLDYSTENSESSTSPRPWNLPHLQRLSISSKKNQGSPLTLLLSRCRLPALVMLSITAPLFGQDASGHLAALFNTNTFTAIQEATLYIRGVDPGPVVSHLSVPCLEFFPLNVGVVKSLSPATKTLRISFYVAATIFAELNRILEYLLVHDSDVQTICIYGGGFKWMSGASSEPLNVVPPASIALVSRLLLHAANLAKKGISIKDDDGKTVMDYFTRS